MKIATKLRIAALAPVVMALVAGIALALSSHALTTAQKRIKNVSDVVTSVNNLNTLVYSYMLYHEERPKQQFMTEQEKISRQLSSIKFSDLEQNQMLYRLRSDVNSMKGLFVKMAANYESVGMSSADVIVREAGERLGGQLLAASSQTVADGLALTRAVNGRCQRRCRISYAALA